MKRGIWVALPPLLLAAVVQAYILPGSSILRRMAERRDDSQVNALKVEGTASFFGAAIPDAAAALGLGGEGAELQVNGAVMLKVPGRCRVEASSLESGRRAAAMEAGGKKKVDGSPLVPLQVALDALCPLLGSRGTEGSFERLLSSLKIDSKETSLARFGGQVAYVLGAQGEGQPQLWIYKDTFQPARLKFNDTAGQAWDVRFIDYASPMTQEWFPRTLEVFKGNERLLKFTASKADGRAKLDDRQF
jgi:hypothetical protein